MKGATIVMAALGGLALLAVWRKEGASVWESLQTSGEQLLGFGPLLLCAFVIMGAMENLLSRQWVQSALGDSSGLEGIALAWLAGALTPGGSLVGLPMAAGLHRVGASPAVLVTYLTSLATLSLIRMPMEVGIIGPRLMMLRVVASLLLPPLAGSITMLIVRVLPAS